MKKYIQNKVSESKLTLPCMSVYALVCWLCCGLLQEGWWMQLGGFVLTTYLMVELNNSNALIRIYSRMVSCAFLMLSCMACFLFPAIQGTLIQFFFVACYLILFHAYQDTESMGHAYYAFLLLGLASMVCIHMVFFLPLLWLFMLLNLQSLSVRTFCASLLGLLTPYWIAAGWLIYQEDFTLMTTHFLPLLEFQQPFELGLLTLSQLLTLAFVVILALTGTIHYIRTSYNDKIRIRQLYSIFIWTDVVTIIFLCVQPQHYDILMRLLIINTAPLIAHFIALTHTRITNIAFFVISVTALLLTAYNIWTSSSLF